MRKKAILLIILMMVCEGLLTGCTEQTGNAINSPSVDIISKSTRTGYEGLEYVVYIDVTVYNRGDDGKVTVWTKLTQGSDTWSKQQAIYLNNNETRDLTFTFREFSFWSLDRGTYLVWVENN